MALLRDTAERAEDLRRPARGTGFGGTAASPLAARSFGERLNFLLTNRIPRRAVTRFIGWFSRIRSPLLARLSIFTWQLFVDDLRLYESEQQRFESLHECFVRSLKPGARPVDHDPDALVSPCDAIVGEFGIVCRQQLIQAKGFPYSLAELLGNEALAGELEGARYATLRLKSSMYHHFHAPCGGRLHDVDYIAGDTWNVNPVALKSIERLYCRNERAVIRIEPDRSENPVVLVAVAAILVASIRIAGIEGALDMAYTGPRRLALKRRVGKGERLGNFEHGSTIVLFAAGNLCFDERLQTGAVVRAGQPLLRYLEIPPSRY